MLLLAGIILTLATTSVQGEIPEDSIALGAAGHVVYRAESSPFKCYVERLRTPAGLNVLEDSPSDHTHHHGLMMAFGVDEVDFWDEADPQRCGRQTPVSLHSSQNSLQHSITWEDITGEPLLWEIRQLNHVPQKEGEPTLLSWQSTLALPEGRTEARLWGRHYFGLGLRFHPDTKGNGNFFNDAERTGTTVAGDEKLTPARWVAFHTVIGGNPVTVAMLDHPLNPRYPAMFFTMCRPFAYMTATANLAAQERILHAGERWNLRYMIAAWDGHVSPEEVERVYTVWTQVPKEKLENVALVSAGARADASSEAGPNHTPDNAIDGRYSRCERHTWHSKAGAASHDLVIDLGQDRSIQAVVIRHEGVLPIADAHLRNSRDFRVQHAQDSSGPWLDLVPPIRGNSDNITYHRFQPTETRYVRVLLEAGKTARLDHIARLAEVEILAARPKDAR